MNSFLEIFFEKELKEVKPMSKQKKSIVIEALFIAITLLLFFPGVSFSGSLEPSEPPGPTMKTLDQIPPTWSQKLQCDSTVCPRFDLVLDGEAVLDKETGLVWERSPQNYEGNWLRAEWQCTYSHTGGRLGWRLPTIYEIVSLYEYCNNWIGFLPCGHPFINLKGTYWSATTFSMSPDYAWVFSPCCGHGYDPKTNDRYTWCIRGGLGVNYDE